jgi:tyrosyl-tRNA synthetase
MGKTESGSVWLKPEWTTPYEYYQYWRNSTDEDVTKFMKLYTFLPLDEINKFNSCEGVELNQAKEILAYEATKLLHGKENADIAKKNLERIIAEFLKSN